MSEKERLCNSDCMLVYSIFFKYLIKNSLALFALILKKNRQLIFQNKNGTNSPIIFFSVGPKIMAFILGIHKRTRTF